MVPQELRSAIPFARQQAVDIRSHVVPPRHGSQGHRLGRIGVEALPLRTDILVVMMMTAIRRRRLRNGRDVQLDGQGGPRLRLLRAAAVVRLGMAAHPPARGGIASRVAARDRYELELLRESSS